MSLIITLLEIIGGVVLILLALVFAIAIKTAREVKKGDYSGCFKADQNLAKSNKQSKVTNISAKLNNSNTRTNDNNVYCPKCSSTSITAQKKGFSLGKAAVGSAIVLPLGIATGMIGKNKIYLTCLNCGHRFKPGKR
jgi:uncharacterized paraquat-inducible protein A